MKLERLIRGALCAAAAVTLAACGSSEEKAPVVLDGNTRPVELYPGELYVVDYKGTPVSEGKVAFVAADRVRVMPLDDAGSEIPHRVAGTVSVPGIEGVVALAQPEGKGYLEAELPGKASFPTTVTLTLKVDNDIEGTQEIAVTGTTRNAFD